MKIGGISTKVKTSELTGAALDWAVALSLQYTPSMDGDVWRESCWFTHDDEKGWMGYEFINGFRPSERWDQAGPIIEREGFKLYKSGAGDWVCSNYNTPHDGRHVLYGDTPLIAVMRCFVAGKLGDEIEIPKELFTRLNNGT